jgi:hypothetical protein
MDRDVVKIFWPFVVAMILVAVVVLYFDRNEDLKKEVSGLNQVANPQTTITKSATGETVASQPKAEVSKETFSNLMDEKLAEYSKKTNQDLGRVLSVVEAKLSTDGIAKVPVHDTTVIRITIRDTVRIPAKVLRWKSRFESGTVLVEGDSATVQTKTVNQLAVIESKDRWKPKHILPWNWGKRKRNIKLLVFNPNTSIDTLSNLSIIKP